MEGEKISNTFIGQTARVRKGYCVILRDYTDVPVGTYYYRSLDNALVDIGFLTCYYRSAGKPVLCQELYYVVDGVVSSLKKTYHV